MSQPMVQYVVQRTEILALTFLTRQPGIFVKRVEFPTLDLLVQLYPQADDARQAVRMFGVVLGGTSQELSNEEQATRFANNKWKHRHDHRPFYFMPILNLLFSMKDDQGYYAWSCHPGLAVGNHDHPILHIPEKLGCKKIERKSLDDIVEVVDGWYEALAMVVYKKASR
jgi:hypothetical protein